MFFNGTIQRNQALNAERDTLALAHCSQELARLRESQNLVNWHKVNETSFDPVPLHVVQDDWLALEDFLVRTLIPLTDKVHSGSESVVGLAPHMLEQLANHYNPELLQLRQAKSPLLLSIDVQITQSGQLVVSAIHADAPLHLGSLLQHRLLLRNLNSEAFADTNIQRLVGFFDQWRESINQLAPTVSDTNIVVLLDPSQTQTYGQYSYLANYLGYSVVHTADLTVRDAKVWLKTLSGLVPVNVILNWTNTHLLDPLELPQADINGIIGLNQAVRRQQVVISNPMHTGLLPLLMPQIESQPILDWPFWSEHGEVHAPLTLRCFALVGEDLVTILPGARAMSTLVSDVSIGHKDVWVEQTTNWYSQDVIGGQWQAGNYVLGEHILTSRTAENLFWLGVYIERAENLIRFVRTYADHLNELPITGSINLQQALSFMHQLYCDASITYPYQGLTSTLQYHNVTTYKKTLVAMFTSQQQGSLQQLLAQIFYCARQVHELMVADGHRTLSLLREYHNTLADFPEHTPIPTMLISLDKVMSQLMALRGAMQDTLTDQNGAFMLKMGHAVGRSELICAQLDAWLNNSLDNDEQLQYMPMLLSTHVSLVTYKRRNRLKMSISQVISLLLSDTEYPRSLSYQIDQLTQLATALPDIEGAIQNPLMPLLWQLKAQCHTYTAEQLASQNGKNRTFLQAQLNLIQQTIVQVNQTLQVHYFSHTELADTRHRQGYIGTERDLL